MENRCKNCSHRNVCKFKRKYEKQFAELQKIKMLDFTSLEVNCKHNNATCYASSSEITWNNNNGVLSLDTVPCLTTATSAKK